MNAIRHALSLGAPAIGGWLFHPTVHSAQLYAEAGFEWVVIDLQHGSASSETAAPVVQNLRLAGLSVMIRVEWNDAAAIMSALDVGANGVIVPMVNTAGEAQSAAAATRYPPGGIRSFGPVYAGASTPQEANADILCLVMIETVEGAANAEEIAAVQGVDGLFFGPADYALALGLAPTVREPEALAALELIVAAAEAHGAFAGTVASDPEHAAEVLALGVKLVTVGSDRTYLRAGATRDVAAIGGLRSSGSAIGRAV